jgi:uncharacterized protein YecA (UPF0149 family)
MAVDWYAQDDSASSEEEEVTTAREQEAYDLPDEMRITPPIPIVEHSPKVGRNDPCPCGSGKKYKKCCGDPTKDHATNT